MRWFLALSVALGLLAGTSSGALAEMRVALVVGNSQIHVATSSGVVYAFGTAKNFGSAPGVHAVDLMLAP